MASGWRGGEEEEEYIDMDLSSGTREEFEFHMSAPLDRSGHPPLASPADELFYKGKLLPLHLPPRAQMVEDLLLLDDHGGRGRGRARVLAVSTAPATPCERSPGAGSCYALSGELNVEEFFREYYYNAAGNEDDDDDDASVCQGKKKPWSRKLRFVSLGGFLKLKAPKAYLKTMFAATAKPSAGNTGGVLGATRGSAKELIPSSHGSHGGRAWRKPKKNPFFSGQARSSIPEQSTANKEREHGHRRSFSSVIVRYSASSKTSPAPPSSSSSSSSLSSSASSSVWSSSGSDGGGAGPALRRSSSASSEAENNPIQGLIAYCKKSQQLASVRKSASDAGFRFLSSSAASKVAAESEDLHDELVEICRSG